MVSNLNWTIKQLKNFIDENKDNIGINDTINVSAPYRHKKINNPKIYVNEVQNVAFDFTNNGERKTLFGLQFDIYCGSIKINNKNANGFDACLYISSIVDNFVHTKLKARRTMSSSPIPSSADDTNEYVYVLRYEYYYDTCTNTIYR